jgi:hypothetical protein
VLDSNAPRLGAAWQLNTTGVDAISPFVVNWFGGARLDPGTPLTQLGFAAPGCNVLVDALIANFDAPAAAGAATMSVTVPATGALLGLQLTAQSLALTSGNAAMVATSNGVQGAVGR